MPTVTRRLPHYQQLIAERLAVTGRLGTDPRHVEAFMRLEHDTLDGLSPSKFDAEVDTCAECVASCSPADAERLADSFGL